MIASGFVITLSWYLLHPGEKSRTVLIENPIATFLSPCTLPHRHGFNTWKRNSVTLVEPVITKNCSLLFRGDAEEIKRVKMANEKWIGTRDSEQFYEWTLKGNCTRIREEFINNFYVSREELEFPLAFSMSVHDNAQQIVRLLKVIYRPHNLYCIHYDRKASSKFRQVFDNIAKCIGNIFIPSKIIKVNWGDYTILDAQLNCIADIYDARTSVDWKYLITLCGKELPLRTNLEMVRLLQPLNGTSALIHFDVPEDDRWRYQVKSYTNSRGTLIRTRHKLGPVPHHLKIYKNLAYFGLTPEFVDYILHDSLAKDLLHFMRKGVSSAEEHFYSTLFAQPGRLTIQ